MELELTKHEQGWLEQQEAIRIGNIKAFLKDLNLLNYFPHYRSEYYNETIIRKELKYQETELNRIREELGRRVIP